MFGVVANKSDSADRRIHEHEGVSSRSGIGTSKSTSPVRLYNLRQAWPTSFTRQPKKSNVSKKIKK
jgi:hypothetical protein